MLREKIRQTLSLLKRTNQVPFQHEALYFESITKNQFAKFLKFNNKYYFSIIIALVKNRIKGYKK